MQPGESSSPRKSNASRPGETAHEYATRLLVALVDLPGVQMTPGVALELAMMLAHVAGGDGRGVYTIVHDRTGDRLG